MEFQIFWIQSWWNPSYTQVTGQKDAGPEAGLFRILSQSCSAAELPESQLHG